MSTFIIVTPGFPANENDTTCLPAFQMFVKSFQALIPNHQIIILAFQYPFFKETYYWNDVRVIALGGKNHGGIRRVLLWLKANKTLKRIKKESEIVGIISFWATECAIVANRFARLNKLKHFIWIIGQDAKKTNKYIHWIKPEATQLVAMSDFLKVEFFKNHSILPSYTIENGISESSFPIFNRGNRPIDILGVGSLIPLKNYDLFIEVIAEVQKKFPMLKAVIIGDGAQRKVLKEKVRLLSLENNIQFLGQLPHAEVFNYMNNAKVFLHTSTYEGNSTVLMEALYSGCYAISSQGLRDSATPNLKIVNNKFEFIGSIIFRLNQPDSVTKRVIFNTMNFSAKKMLDLFMPI